MKKLLIANRGEIARRIIRTAHRMGIATVAVYADADAQALHVREASVAVALGGNAPADTYLNADKLLAAARASGAEAVHPGYGFLSENADFAQAVADAGLIWVGPSAAAIRALGNKSAAKQLAHRLRLPCLPGYEGEDQSDARFAHEAGRIGYPVMVKAAAGGGGRGMRLVTAPAQLLAALSSARSEAQSGFGSGELLIERALLQPRHVEVQVFADAHGHCIHLGERDCSVQRRHQKIIEEAPSPAISPALRASMGACAVELALAAGYVGAGTVEFLVEAHEHGGEAGEATSVGATAAAKGRPEQGSAPRTSEAQGQPAQGGSAAHAVASVGATAATKGRPEQGSAPPGGSAVREATSVGAHILPGMFAQGQFELGTSSGLTLPQQAVVIRDGFSHVFRLGSDNRVSELKVKTGRRNGDQVEVVEGLSPDDLIVVSGAGFLNDGDLVKVVAPRPPTPTGVK